MSSLLDAIEEIETAVPSSPSSDLPPDSQAQPQPGLLVTKELQKALEECKARVARIAKDCKARNKKFRDVEFDLENDMYRCLHGLDYPLTGKYAPSDVQRVTQIFDKPQFFVNGADSNDILQGKIGDCWFLSALATVSTAQGLVEKFCVARDEEVGVYGFIFFRDSYWVNVIIDDLLYTCVPKYEELTLAERELYHDDKDQFNKSARKGGKTLYFARSGATGETWVPLIEKAYAKLHGDYHSLAGGKALEAAEDLTGGVSTAINTKDILDVDRFWHEELLNANHDRLFGCSFEGLDSNRSGVRDPKVDGLFGDHSYSVLRAVECKGKRFVVLRNPWGCSEWTGRWSDGSKEWTREWLDVLPVLGHEFGDDGQFVMEYDDFLASWSLIFRTFLFDSTWIMASEWVQVPIRPLPVAWSHGDVIFTLSLPQRTPTIIVLSQLDKRYFKEISGISCWNLDFVLVRRGQEEPIAEASSAFFFTRSVNLEIELDAGEYVIYVRVDRATIKDPDYFKKGVDSGWDHRKLSRILTERAKGQSIASNFVPGNQHKYLPMDLSKMIKRDLVLYEKQQAIEAAKKEEQENDDTKTVTVTVTTTTTTTTTYNKKDSADSVITRSPSTPVQSVRSGSSASIVNAPTPKKEESCLANYGPIGISSPPPFPRVISPPSPMPLPMPLPLHPLPLPLPRQPEPSGPPRIEINEDENSLFLGLRIYTKEAAAIVGRKLFFEMDSPPVTRPPSPVRR